MKKLYQVGPKKTLKGGIATVINNINKSEVINKEYDIVNIETINEKGKIVFIKSLFFSFFIKEDSIVHFHVASKGSFFRKYIIFKIVTTKCKKIFHLHGGGFLNFYDNSNKIIKKMIKDMLFNSDIIINVSDNMQNALIIKFPEIKYKCVRIYNSIDYKGTDLSFEEKENFILFMGKLTEYKGIYDLLDIIFNIRDDIRKRGWNFKIAGNGDVEKVKKFIEDNSLNDIVDVLGWVDGQEKIKLLEKSKIFFMPSHVESFGIAAIEAMEKGNLVVASDKGALPEIIKNGEQGYIVKRKSEYSKVLLGIIDDESNLRRICVNNIFYSKRYSEKIIFNELVKTYREL
ncbi:glycosyltransferase family 4 protein [Clostridium perfringens]|uniref:glycosyltransferase family 4 protein n=1 Tax=Clostridium perfringens TaxID=1502 RepID=UPI0039EB803A